MIATVTFNPSLDEWVTLSSLKLGVLNRAAGWSRYAGGKGINVSRVVRELGGRTIAFGLAGGEDGTILRERLNRMTLPHVFVDVPGSTRNNYKIQSALPPALTEINCPGPRVRAAAINRLQRALLRQAGGLRGVALSGSLPPGVPPTIYARWIRRLRRRRIPAVLDASGVALRRGCGAHPWLVKPNRQEAEELLGRRLSSFRQVVDAAQAVSRQARSIVILSLGKEGAVLASSGASWLARPPAVRVDSAVGAGDSLVGGLLFGWLQTGSLLEAFRLGIACGAATAMTPGTELCHRRDVYRILPRIKIKRVS